MNFSTFSKKIFNIIVLIFTISLVNELSAQSHFSFTSNTGNNATIGLPTSANPSINSTGLSNGDEIGVFTPNGLCIGAAVWQGSFTAITVWGDDPQTAQVDGAQDGQTYIYRVWDVSAQCEYDIVSVSYQTASGNPQATHDDGKYHTNSIQLLSGFTATPVPGTPVLAMPADNAANAYLKPEFDWDIICGFPETSHLQIDDNSNFSSVIVNTANINSTPYTITSNLSYNTTYYWRVRGNNSNGNGDWSAYRTFTTLQAPNISGETSVCINETETYSTPSISGVTYEWTVVSGGSISGTSTNNTVTVDWTASGSGVLNLKRYTSESTPALIDDTNYEVSVNQLPDPVINGDTDVCVNTEKVYATAAGTGLTNVWNVSGGTVTSSSNEQITVSWGSAGAGTVEITQTNTNTGCVGTSSININKHEPPQQAAITGSDAVCENSSQQYSVPQVNGVSNSWTVSGGSMTQVNNNTINVDWGSAGQGNVTLTQSLDIADGCETINTLDVDIIANPNPQITGSLQVCENVEYTYSANTTTDVTNSWNVTGGTYTTQPNGDIVVTWGSSGSGIIELTQTSTLSNCSATEIITVNINAYPSVPAINGNASVCENETVVYTIDQVSGVNNTWSVSGGTYTQLSAESIEVTWGASGQGTVSITQSTEQGGCSTDNTLNVTINDLPDPQISGNTEVCSEAAETYTSNAGTDESSSWVVTGGTISGSSTDNSLTVLWGDTGSGTITLTVTNNTTSCEKETTQNININDLPDPSITGDDESCPATIKTYTASALPGGTNLWQVSGGSISGPNNEQTVDIEWGNQLSTGTVTLSQTNEDGCSQDTEIDVTIHGLPEAPVLNGELLVCANQIQNYSITTPSNTENVWSVTGGTIQGSSIGSAVQVLWGNPGGGTITIIRTDENTGCQVEESWDITIQDSPGPEIQGDTDICHGDTVRYTSEAGSGITNAWSAEGGNIIGGSTGASVDVIWTSSGGGVIELTQTNQATGCFATEEIGVNVAPKPKVNIFGSLTSCSQCSETYSTLSEPLTTFSWSATNGTIEGNPASAQITINWDQPGTGTITLTKTNASGCTSVKTVTVTINEGHEPAITGDFDVCSGEEISYNASGSGIQGIIHEWTVQEGVIIGADNEASVTVEWGDAGQGTLFLRQQIPASNFDETVSEEVLIRDLPQVTFDDLPEFCTNDETYTFSEGLPVNGIYTGPGVNNGNTFDPSEAGPGEHVITYLFQDAFGCENNASTTITVYQSPGQPELFWNEVEYYLESSYTEGNQWYFNGAVIPDETSRRLYPVQTGNYTVVHTNENGCESIASEPHYIDITSAGDYSALRNNIKVFPNPAKDVISISVPAEFIDNSTYADIINSMGSQVISREVSMKEMSFDLNFLSSGLYILRIRSGNQIYNFEFIINK